MLRTVVQLSWRERILGWLRRFRWTPVRRLLVFAFFMGSGWVAVGTIAGAALLVPPIRHFVGFPESLGILALAAVGMYAAYETGREETLRGEVVFSQSHVEQMREVAKNLLASVGGQQGTTAYAVPFHEAQTRDHLIKQLESHHPMLELGELALAWSAVGNASQSLKAQCDRVASTLDVDLPPPIPPAGQSIGLESVLYAVAMRQYGSPTEWEVTQRSDGRTLLITKPPTFPLDVTGKTPEGVEQTKSDFAKVSEEAPAWAETQTYRTLLQNRAKVQMAITDKLAPLAAIQTLPRGTRCDICDPPPAPRIKKVGPLSRLLSRHDLSLRPPSQESEGKD